MQQPYAQSIVCAHLLRLVRRGERNEARLASRGVFLICGILACPDYEYVPGRSLRTDSAEIVFRFAGHRVDGLSRCCGRVAFVNAAAMILS
jgi:hypothetical protein